MNEIGTGLIRPLIETPGILKHPIAWSPIKGSTIDTFIGLHKATSRD